VPQLLTGSAMAVLADARQAPGERDVAEDLNAVAHLVSRTSSLATALTDFGIPTSSRQGVLRDLLTSRIDQRALRIVLRAIETERLDELPTVLHELFELAQHVRDLPPESLRAQEPIVSRTAWRDYVAGYADAVFEDVPQTATLEDIEDELFRFARVVEASPALGSALSDGAAPLESRERILGDLLGAKVHPATLRLARLTLQGRVRDLVASLDWLGERAAWARGWRVARVRSAMDIDDDERRALAEALERITHGPVELQVTPDPGAIGGAVIEIGDLLVDASVRRRLEQLQEHLLNTEGTTRGAHD